MDFGIEKLSAQPESEFKQALLTNFHHFEALYRVCGSRFWYGCGSYLIDGQTYSYCPLMYEKQKLLFDYAKTGETLLELGVYMGHSLLICLLANPKLKIVAVDISDELAFPSITYLNSVFGNVITFLHNNSHQALELLKTQKQTFDLFHIDTDHRIDVLVAELNNVVPLFAKERAELVIDDYDCFPDLGKSITYKEITVPTCNWPNALISIEQ